MDILIERINVYFAYVRTHTFLFCEQEIGREGAEIEPFVLVTS